MVILVGKIKKSDFCTRRRLARVFKFYIDCYLTKKIGFNPLHFLGDTLFPSYFAIFGQGFKTLHRTYEGFGETFKGDFTGMYS
jgi:hypothetical protein